MDSLEELESKVFAKEVKVKAENVEDKEEPVMPDIINSDEGAILIPSLRNENIGCTSQDSDNGLYRKSKILECPGLSCSSDLECFKRPKHSKQSNTDDDDAELNRRSYYQCPECPFSSRQQLNFKKHFKKHLAKVGAKCAHCSFRMTHKSGIRSHEKIHERTIPLLKCAPCSLVFNTKRDLEEHMLFKHKISPIFNTQYYTENALELKRESPSPLGDNVSIVEDQNKNLSTSQIQESLDFNRFSETAKENECMVDFSSAAYIFYDTYGRKWFKCTSESCPFRTESNVSLKRHWVNHTSNGPFKCLYCSFRSKNQRMLTSHLLEHVAAQSDSCNSLVKREEKEWLNCTISECPYKTQDLYSLKRHTVYHGGKGALKCHFCSFRCRNPRPFKFHFRQHCRERSYRNNYYEHGDCSLKDNKRKSNVISFSKHKRKIVEKCLYCSFSGTLLEVNTHRLIHEKTDTNQFPAESNETSDDDDVPLINLKTRLDMKKNLCTDTNNTWRNPQQSTKTVMESSSNCPDSENEDNIKPVILRCKRNGKFKKTKNARPRINALRELLTADKLNPRVEPITETEKETCSVGQNSKLNGSNHRITITITTSKGSSDNNSSMKTELVAEILKSFGASNKQKESSDISIDNDEKKSRINHCNKEKQKTVFDSSAVVTDILNSFDISNEELNDYETTTLKIHYQKDHRTYKNNRRIRAAASDSLKSLDMANVQDPGDLGADKKKSGTLILEDNLKVACDNEKRKSCNFGHDDLRISNSIHCLDEVDVADLTLSFDLIDSNLKTEQELVQNLILLDNLNLLKIFNKKEESRHLDEVLEKTENLSECNYQKSRQYSAEKTTSDVSKLCKVPNNLSDNESSGKLNEHCCSNSTINCSNENGKLNERDTFKRGVVDEPLKTDDLSDITANAITIVDNLMHFHAKNKYRKHCDVGKQRKRIKIIKSINQDAPTACVGKLNTDDSKKTCSYSDEKLIKTIVKDDTKLLSISNKRPTLCDLKRTYSKLNERKSLSTINISNKNGECELYTKQGPVASKSCNNGNFSKINVISDLKLNEDVHNKTLDSIDTTVMKVLPNNLSKTIKSIGEEMLKKDCNIQDLEKIASVGNTHNLIEEEFCTSRSENTFSDLSEYNLGGCQDRNFENSELSDECNQESSIDNKQEKVDDLRDDCNEETTSIINNLNYFYAMDAIGQYYNINYQSEENNTMNYNSEDSQSACTDGQLTKLIIRSNLSENDNEINETLDKDDKEKSGSCNIQHLVNTKINDDIHNERSSMSSPKRNSSNLNKSKSISSGNISDKESKGNLSAKQTEELNPGNISSKGGNSPKVSATSDLSLHINDKDKLKIDACNKLHYSTTKVFVSTNIESLKKLGNPTKTVHEQASDNHSDCHECASDLVDKESKSNSYEETERNANNSNEDCSRLEHRLSGTMPTSDSERYPPKQSVRCTFSRIDQHRQTNRDPHSKETENAPKGIDMEFKCRHCPDKISGNKSFKIHLKKHLEPKGVRCPLCTYTSNKSDLLKHLSCHVRNIDGRFRCPLCETEKRTSENMNDHLKVGHFRAIFQKHESSCCKKKSMCDGCC